MPETKGRIKIIKGKKFTDELPEFLNPDKIESVQGFHKTVDNYDITPLANLSSLAKEIGVKGIFVKDESYRFGLNSFKGLGSIYAIAKIICNELGIDAESIDFMKLTSDEIIKMTKDMVFVTATDGNHGKGVAWSASKFGCKAVVYMPKGSKECRAEAIKAINSTEVIITELNYDDTVRLAAKNAISNGWHLVQDTGWQGYYEIPRLITQGYATMAAEALEQLSDLNIDKPTHVFLQAGVGSMAGGVLGYLANYYHGSPPVTTIVEPETVACIFESAKAMDGSIHFISGNPTTIMAGLNCGEPSTITWPILRDFAEFYASCPDYVTAEGMRTLANPNENDPKVISGESGAVGFGLLYLILQDDGLKEYGEMLEINKNSVILIFNTEGDTDPDGYNDIIYNLKYPLP